MSVFHYGALYDELNSCCRTSAQLRGEIRVKKFVLQNYLGAPCSSVMVRETLGFLLS